MAQAKQAARRSSSARGKPPAATSEPPICSVSFCPVCTAVTALGEARPDLLEHLLVAGREMLLVVRALIDARLEGSAERPTKMRRLTIE